ncbi:glycerophosphodiester phosphodiesterase family protein [Frigidibacter sp. MR17.24]|uniref:glycerophosphodiester phosphodiesterase family protein n=1 Tax=Frigidibacter sp. MR17.24 TaxID=3127345 RepID=UPI0030131519
MTSYRHSRATRTPRVAVVAHRGHWDAAPENSLAAIVAAAEAGCTVAEIDIRRTADGALVLMHDASCRRTTGHDLAPAAATLAELSALPLLARDGGPGAAPTAQTVPTLAAALAVARGRIFLDLDLKDLSLAPEVIAAVRAAGAEDRVDLKARVETAEDCRRLAALQAESGIAMMAMARFTAATCAARLDALAAAPPFMVEASFDDADLLPAICARLNRLGTAVWVNTLDCAHDCGLSDSAALADPDAVWGRLVRAGVSAIQTDAAPRLLAWLAHQEVPA